jgi:hypothetical protein
MTAINWSWLEATEMSLIRLTAGVAERYNKKWRY